MSNSKLFTLGALIGPLAMSVIVDLIITVMMMANFIYDPRIFSMLVFAPLGLIFYLPFYILLFFIPYGLLGLIAGRFIALWAKNYGQKEMIIRLAGVGAAAALILPLYWLLFQAAINIIDSGFAYVPTLADVLSGLFSLESAPAQWIPFPAPLFHTLALLFSGSILFVSMFFLLKRKKVDRKT